MKPIRIFILFLIFIYGFIAIFSNFAGPDGGFMQLDWEEIKQVNGGARECLIFSDEDESFFLESYSVYDEKGRIVEYDMVYTLLRFTYNVSGLAEIDYSGIDENDEFIFYGKTIYTYDAKGKLKKISYLDSEGNEYMSEESITYDKNGNIKIERLTPEGSVYKADVYNKNFFLIESVVYTTDSVAMGSAKKEVESKTTIKYDKDNNLVERAIEYITPPFEGMPKKITQSFKNELDNKGNKIVQKTTLSPEEAGDMVYDLVRPVIKFKYAYEGDKSLRVPDKKEVVIEQQVMVEYEGKWYPVVILEQDGDKYLIHYVDYDESWDEWVTEDRIQFGSPPE